MQQKFFWGTFIVSILVLAGCHCHQEERYVTEVEQRDSCLYLQTNEFGICFRPLSNHAIEVEYLIDGHINPPSYALVHDKKAHISTFFHNDEDIVSYGTGSITVKIQKSPLHISYYRDGRLLFAEEQGLVMNDSVKGFRMRLEDDEKLMGGGERVLGMDRRGHRLRLYNQASYGYGTKAELMYYSMPIVMSSHKYMLLFDNTADGYMDLGKTEHDILQFESVGGRLSYVVTASDSWQSLTENYTAITGKQPMPPRWALGNISSRMGYRSRQQVEDVVDLYYKKDFPLDAIVLDLYWFGPDLKGHMGNLDWDRKAFPKPEEMMREIKQKGVKTILITEPFILKNSAKFVECVDQHLLGTDSLDQPYIYDFYFGTTALLDIFNPKTKDWFWRIYKKHMESGVDGWWGDLGEPEVHPDALQHINGSANLLHNVYGHEWAGVIYHGYGNDFSDKRPVILMRSGYAGSQRYGMLPWSGDVSRSWEGLQSQVEIALQMGMQGLAYMHSDLGGFAGDYKDAELYTRWLQYGVFQPIYRTHAQEDVPPEPVFWDRRTQEITRRYIKLRYALTPYLYTMAYQNSTKGTPLMRPLFYMEDDTTLLNERNSYLWGDNFLVAPVTEKGTKKWTVHFPQGSNWYHFFTDEKVEGGQDKEVLVDINDIPVFVKGGSFIPMVPAFRNMEEYSSRRLLLHFYNDPTVSVSQDFMYEDDGETNNSWKNQKFEKMYFNASKEHGALSIDIVREAYDYNGKPEHRELSLFIHHLDTKPKSLIVNKAEHDFTWIRNKQMLKVDFVMESDSVTLSMQ